MHTYVVKYGTRVITYIEAKNFKECMKLYHAAKYDRYEVNGELVELTISDVRASAPTRMKLA